MSYTTKSLNKLVSWENGTVNLYKTTLYFPLC